jgi:hypothetical protein
LELPASSAYHSLYHCHSNLSLMCPILSLTRGDDGVARVQDDHYAQNVRLVRRQLSRAYDVRVCLCVRDDGLLRPRVLLVLRDLLFSINKYEREIGAKTYI